MNAPEFARSALESALILGPVIMTVYVYARDGYELLEEVQTPKRGSGRRGERATRGSFNVGLAPDEPGHAPDLRPGVEIPYGALAIIGAFNLETCETQMIYVEDFTKKVHKRAHAEVRLFKIVHKIDIKSGNLSQEFRVLENADLNEDEESRSRIIGPFGVFYQTTY